MTHNTRHSKFGISLPRSLGNCLSAIGMVFLLSGFDASEVEFNSVDVPPSKFKIRWAKQKGLPAPEGSPGLPVKAILTKPEGKEPFPAIVMFPNGGGWPGTPRHWRERFNSWGYLTLEIGDQNEVPEYMEPPILVLDAIGALKYLKDLPYVDSNRVAIMGWDQGAGVAFWAIDASSWAGRHKDRFVAAVAITPPCDLLSASQFFSPALIISAALDDLAKPSGCERLVKSVPQDLNVPILKVIPGAYHWFDMPRRPFQLDNLFYSRNFDTTWEYNAEGTETAADYVRTFLETNF